MPPPQQPPYYGQPAKPATSPWIWIVLVIAIFTCTCPILAAVLFPVFSQARLAAKRTVALSNAKQVALGALMYANDWDDKLPTIGSASDLQNKLGVYIGKSEPLAAAATYAWNDALEGIATTRVKYPAKVWMLHSGEPDTSGKSDVCFVDGACKIVTESGLAEIVSRPPELGPEEDSKSQSKSR